MNPSDEELLHRFYAGETDALEILSQRHESLLDRIAYQLLLFRTGSAAQATAEWDVSERLLDVWTLVFMSRQANAGRWPHQRISALTWLIHLLCIEMDRHLGLRPPF